MSAVTPQEHDDQNHDKQSGDGQSHDRQGADRQNARALRAVAPVLFVAILGILEFLTRAEILPPLFFPPPSQVFARLVEMIGSGELGEHLTATVSRILIGFLAGGIPGMLLGMLMGWSQRVRTVVDPFVAAIHPVPKISLLPIIMIIFGIGFLSRTLVVAVSAFFPMLINAMAGVRQIHPVYFEAAQNCGASRRQILRKVVFPGALPFVLAGVRLALNTALSLTVAIELLMSDKGLGSLIWMAWQTLRIKDLYAAITIAALLGIAIRLFVQLLQSRLVQWQVKTQT